MRFHTLLLLAGVVLLSTGELLHAQGIASRSNAGIPHYQPQTPTLSPYLNLLRPQGALPNYYALVRPMQRQQAFDRQTSVFQRQQAEQVERLQRAFAQPQVLPTGTAGWFFDEGRHGFGVQLACVHRHLGGQVGGP